MDKIEANTHYIASDGRPARPDHVRPQDQGARCSWPANGRTSRRAGTAPTWCSTSPARTQKWFTFTNGAHVDSLDPYTFDRWYDFFELFVAHQAPIVNQALIRAAAPVIYQQAMGLPNSTSSRFRPTRSSWSRPTIGAGRVRAAAAVRVLFDNGAGTSPTGSTTAGDSYPGFEQSFSKFPIPARRLGTWYFGPNGTLDELQPSTEGVDSYTSNANAVPLTDYAANTGPGGLWGNASEWQWNWPPTRRHSGLLRVGTATTNTTAIGGGAVHLWVSSSTPDVDLQATVSEVRPDGNETFVQNGWIRASERKLAATRRHVQAEEHAAPADPELARVRRRSPCRQRNFVLGRHPALLPGPRVPRRLAYPGHDFRT